MPSPVKEAYRNKMEFSFGDEYKDGPLALGMHKRGSFHDIVNVMECRIVDEDYRKILACTGFCQRDGASLLPSYAPYGIFPSSAGQKGRKDRGDPDRYRDNDRT